MSETGAGAEMASGFAAHLSRIRVPPELLGTSDERCFQQWITEQLREWLEKRYSGTYRTIGEASGGGIAPVPAFGAGSWPDVAAGSAASPFALAIEVKCLKKRGLPNRVAHALGQALMYREVYDASLVVFAVVEEVRMEVPNTLLARLAENGIAVGVVRAWNVKGVGTRDL